MATANARSRRRVFDMENLGLALMHSTVVAIGVGLLIVFWPFRQGHEGAEQEHSVDEEGEDWLVEDAA